MKSKFKIKGLDCANCAEKIRSRVENLQEVIEILEWEQV